MHDDPQPADAGHAMTTLLRYQQQRAGRFGRAVPHEDDDANETGQSEIARYAIDADAVAEAIVARLLAGRTIQCRPPE